ncbi:Fe-S oxidoreductase [alpha proteobacterium HIMB114]|nr:Fe-S oxidoreductase [alpha proteobacterium HIMB114]
MSIDQSDFESEHNKRFHLKGKSALEIKKGKKNILLIGPQTELASAERSFMAPALGVIRLAGYLNKKGHYAESFEPNLSMLTGKPPFLEEVLKKKKWDIIGFSVLEETFIFDIENMQLAEKICPEAIFIAGGIEAQFNYQNVLDKTPCKFVIISEGEKSLLALADGKPINEIPGIVFKNSSVPLDQHTFDFATSAIDWEELPYEEYWDYYVNKYGDKITEQNLDEIHTVRVFSRNRCPIGCKFCSSTNQITWGSEQKVPVISASEETLIHNIKRICNAHPRTRTIYLTDDDFCINKRSVIRFCEKVIKEKEKNDLPKHLTFMSFCRASDASVEMFEWMKKAGFRRLNIGIESFSTKVLHEMNKKCTAEENHECMKIAKQTGVGPYANIIVTTPESTLEDVEKTVNEAYQYTLDPFFHLGVTMGIKPLKGTDYYETFSDFRTRIVPIKNTQYHLKYDDLIYAKDPRVKHLQIRYWNEIDDYMNEEIQKNDIRHGNARNLSQLKLIFLKKLVKEIKENKLEILSNFKDDLNKSDPYNERQTVDVGTDVEYNPKKTKKNKSKWGSWS